MPSPFPGMDPYLEEPGFWPGFHNALIAEMARVLNRDLPDRYFAQTDTRCEIELFAGETRRDVIPDIAVLSQSSGTTAVASTVEDPLSGLDQPLTESVILTIDLEPVELGFIEIRDAQRHHELVTLLELISPSNKRPGRDREAYVLKRREIFQSAVSLVEIDLLRTGERISDREWGNVQRKLPPHDYEILISRAWQRLAPLKLEYFPVQLEQPLPSFPVPLRAGEQEILLNLQLLFTQAYDAGPYRRGAVNYQQPPRVPLNATQEAWRSSTVCRSTS